jgi:acyl carrier protein
MNESEIEDRFLHVSPETIETIRQYRGTYSPQLIPKIVHGILQKYLPLDSHDGAVDQVESLNAFRLESITLMEVLLDIQDALEITLTDEELRQLRSFDETIVLLSKKVAELQKKMLSNTTTPAA